MNRGTDLAPEEPPPLTEVSSQEALNPVVDDLGYPVDEWWVEDLEVSPPHGEDLVVGVDEVPVADDEVDDVSESVSGAGDSTSSSDWSDVDGAAGEDLAADVTGGELDDSVQETDESVEALAEPAEVLNDVDARADAGKATIESLGEVNTLRSFEPEGATNCGSCALAVDTRLDGSEPDAVCGDFTVDVPEMEAITGRPQGAASPDEIQAGLLEVGPGAKTIVGIDRVDGPGHWFNAYNDGGKVKWIDGQSGEKGDWPPTHLGNVSNWDWNGAS